MTAEAGIQPLSWETTGGQKAPGRVPRLTRTCPGAAPGGGSAETPLGAELRPGPGGGAREGGSPAEHARWGQVEDAGGAEAEGPAGAWPRDRPPAAPQPPPPPPPLGPQLPACPALAAPRPASSSSPSGRAEPSRQPQPRALW